MRSARRIRRTAFTLIELMAVMLILGILLALIISVGVYLRNESGRKSTMATIEILSAAVAAYQEEKGVLPVEGTAAGTDEQQAQARSKSLYTQLNAAKSSSERLANLPEEAIDKDNSWFRDGFERAIDYRISGGMGGAPLLVSAGPDGEYGFNPADANKQKDNLQK